MPTGHGPRTIVTGASGPDGTSARASATAVAMRSRRVTFAASRASMCGRGDGVLGEQETGRLEGLADATGGVQPRRERERHGLEVDGRGRDARPLEQCGDPRPRVSSQPLEAEPRDGPVLSTIGATSACRSSRDPWSSAAPGPPSSSWATLNATPLPARRGSG